MDKNTALTYLGVIAVLIIPIISEWYSPTRNNHIISGDFILLFVVIFAGLLIVFNSKITRLITKIPDSLILIRKFLALLLHLLQTPVMKLVLFLFLITVNFLLLEILTRIAVSSFLFGLYIFELRKKQSIVSWAQGKKPKFQDNFNDGLKNNWDVISGSFFLEKNFGNPAPDLLLKQVGNSSATPQTFSVLKNISINKPSTIECDVFIEPRGIFNLVFGLQEKPDKYFMARFDSRETEFDALLYKPENTNWNFIIRSDKYRTTWSVWHRIKLEILSSQKVNLYKDGELIISRELEKNAFGRVAIMNEEADVHVDNIVITEI